MRILGLTGGSGTGKSTVAALFAEKGVPSVDADGIYRTLCADCQPMLAALGREFDVLTEKGTLDRPRLAKIVFTDPARLARLDEITTPYIREASLAALHACGSPLVLYDAPTLFETGADAICDGAIGVLAPHEVRLSRIMARDGLTQEAARARILAQPDDGFYRARCAYLLRNDGDLAALGRAVDTLFDHIQNGGY